MIHKSRRLEREAQRNVELMWLGIHLNAVLLEQSQRPILARSGCAVAFRPGVEV
jgi:hypothetical protein